MKGLAEAKKGLTNFGSGIASVGKWVAAMGAVITAPILAATHTWATAGEEILHMSQRTGLAVEKLSELKYAAAESGVSAEELEHGIVKLQKAIGRLSATPESTAALQRLGISLAEIRGKSPDEQFALIADKISRISDPTDRASAALALFGKSGAGMLPMLMRGRAGLAALTAEAREWGFVVSKKSAEGAAELAGSFRRLELVTTGIWKTLGSALGPATKEFTDILARNLRTVKEWLAANGDIVRTVFKWASAVVLGGTALYGLGKAFMLAGSAIGAFRSAVLWAAGSVDSLVKIGALIVSPFRQAASAAFRLAGSILFVRIPAMAARAAMLACAAASAFLRGAAVLGSFGVAGFSMALSGLAMTARATPAAVMGIYGAMKGVASVVDVSGRAVAAGTQAMASGFMAGVRGIYALASATPALRAFSLIGSSIGGVARALTVGLGGTLGAAWSGLLGLPQRIGTGFSLAARFAQMAWSAAAAATQVVWGAVQAIPGILSTAYSVAAAWVGAVWSAIPGAISAAWSFVLSIPALLSAAYTAAAAIAGAAWTALPAAIAGAWATFIAALPAILTGAIVVGAAAALGYIVYRFAPGVITAVKNAAVSAAEGLKNSLGSAIVWIVHSAEGIWSGFADLVPAISASVSGILTNLSGGFSTLWADLQAGWKQVSEDATTAFSVISDSIASGNIQGAITVATAFIKLEWARAMAWMAGSWVEVKYAALGAASYFVGVWGGVKAFFGSIIDNMIGGVKELGNALKAVWAGIQAAWGKLKHGDVKGMASAFAEAFNATLAAQKDVEAPNAFKDFGKAYTESRAAFEGNMGEKKKEEKSTAVADAQKNLDAATAAFDDAKAEVGKANADALDKLKPPPIPKTGPGGAAGQMTAKTEGAFGYAAARLSGPAGTAAERTAKATEAMRRTLEAIKANTSMRPLGPQLGMTFY